MPNSTDSLCRKAGENLRRPALHAIKEHSGTKSTRIAPSNTLTDSHTQFLPEKPNFSSIYLLWHPNSYHTKLYYRSLPCPYTLVDSVRFFIKTCFITLLSYTQSYHIVEVYPTTKHCWAIHCLTTLSNNGRSKYIAVSFRATLWAANQNRVMRHPISHWKLDLTKWQTDDLITSCTYGAQS